MTEKLKELYEQLYKGESAKDSKIFIEIAERNLNMFDGTTYENSDDVEKAGRIMADYAIALSNDNQPEKSLAFLTKAINRIENTKELMEDNPEGKELYESLIFHRGMAMFQLKRYKEAKSDFRMLIDKFPGNSKYKYRYNEIIRLSFRKTEWIFVVLIILISVVCILIEKKDPFVYRVTFGALMVALIGFYVVSLSKKRQQIR